LIHKVLRLSWQEYCTFFPPSVFSGFIAADVQTVTIALRNQLNNNILQQGFVYEKTRRAYRRSGLPAVSKNLKSYRSAFFASAWIS
jgi:hypothetical protein